MRSEAGGGVRATKTYTESETREGSQVCLRFVADIVPEGRNGWGQAENHSFGLGHVEFEVPWRPQNRDDIQSAA